MISHHLVPLGPFVATPVVQHLGRIVVVVHVIRSRSDFTEVANTCSELRVLSSPAEIHSAEQADSGH